MFVIFLLLVGCFGVRIDFSSFIEIPQPKQLCSGNHGSILESDDQYRVKNLVVDRDMLELVSDDEFYLSAGSKRDAFQAVCEGCSKDPFVRSFGASSDKRELGTHFLHIVEHSGRKCDLTFGGTTILLNREWFRNIWHRVSTDIFPIFQALYRFAPDETNLSIMHLDFAEPSFLELYEMITPNVTWMSQYPKDKRVFCFEDALFMLSKHWASTFVEHGSMPLSNPWVQEFGEWMTARVGIDAESSFIESEEITITWISRNASLKGNRAFVNEDKVISELSEAFGDRVIIRKVVLEEMTIKQQMFCARTSDILFGMHGAGLTHILFLPKHAVVLEVIPKEMQFFLYKRVSSLNGLTHYEWINDDENDLVDWTWKPYSKFTNLKISSQKLLPFFKKGIETLKENLKPTE